MSSKGTRTKQPTAVTVDQFTNRSKQFFENALKQAPDESQDRLPFGLKITLEGAVECIICQVRLPCRGPSSVTREHMNGKTHTLKCLYHALKKQRPELVKDKDGVRVASDYDAENGYIKFDVEESKNYGLAVGITNESDRPVYLLKCLFLKKIRIFKLESNIKRGRTVIIEPGQSHMVQVTIKPKHIGRFNCPLAFMLTDNVQNGNRTHIVRYISAYCTNELIKQLQPTTPYKPPRKVVRRPLGTETVEGLPPPGAGAAGLERELDLENNTIPKHINKMLNKGLNVENPDENLDEEVREKIENFRQVVQSPLTMSNYRGKFSGLLHVEEHQMNVDIRHYDMDDVTMNVYKPNKRLLTLRVPGLAENRPSLLRGDKLFVSQHFDKGVRKSSSTEYIGYVHMVLETEVVLGFGQKLLELFIPNMKFNVRFTFSRHPLKLMHRAVQLAEEHSLDQLLFPATDTCCSKGTIDDFITKPLQFYDRKLETNVQQSRAVRHILAGTSRPAPYVVFGPPGTGKTVTMVEAMKQVWKNIPGSHVLACAPSNSAADLIAERLIKHIPATAVFRMHAVSRTYKSIPEDIRCDKRTNVLITLSAAAARRGAPQRNLCGELLCAAENRGSVNCPLQAERYKSIPEEIRVCGNIDADGIVSYPNKEELIKKTFIICTLTTAGRLASANFPQGHFSHVFIDESGHAMEPEAVVALAGIMESDTTDKYGQVVLCGDPKQLGPILRSPVSKTCGLGKSLLERFMEDVPIYKRIETEEESPDVEHYDSRLITKLVMNYRSHPKILHLPNSSFYNDELKCGADQLLREAMCNWSKLPKKGFPLIFHGIIGEDMREAKSPSFFNPQEVSLVKQYVKELMDARGIKKLSAKDIGIITPYRKQVQKIKSVMTGDPKTKDIKVGSVEEFQGQERTVVIISTVRSSPDLVQFDTQFRLGFLRNAKRFNVAITRAKALLIVIGNPYFLSSDPHWNALLNFILDNGAYTGHGYEKDDTDAEWDDIIKHLQDMDLDDLIKKGGETSAVQQMDDPAWGGNEAMGQPHVVYQRP